ncbi:cupin domain-containing protein [Amycolatopsis sp. K13G38]|uniref:Cupin domain-containing protein n=1 Tax=Amycolatopsis acididurans TaxID=2724524 RepID=A0ABX1JAD4_9PSEU|nr:cupin domain-containing protein [Amycolatopsis acididurans]NKQ55505.1 cupin domain-containing protein [Amycolatopsis acididurans]
MSSEPEPKLARRVITGLNAEGRSTIVADGATPRWVRRPTGSVIMDVWSTGALPVRVDDEENTDGPQLVPPRVGLCVRLAVFPPDEDVDGAGAAAYQAAMHQIYGDQGNAGGSAAIPGMHRTDTVDVVTVVDGEIWVVLEEGETLLRAGDTLVQRGTRHAWRNRSDRPCTLATTMITAVRG